MTILIINNYYKKRNLNRVDKIVKALQKAGKQKYEIWSFSQIKEKKIRNDVEAIILSGSSVHLQNQDKGPDYTAEIELIKEVEVPVLGICFGHQLIGKAFGSSLDSLQKPVKGFRDIKIVEPNEIFSSFDIGTKISVSQYHKDYLTNLPKGFVWLASSESSEIEAMKHGKKPIYGVQAHIERANDQNSDGLKILENFIVNVVEKTARPLKPKLAIVKKFKKKVAESEEKYGISNCIYNRCLEEIRDVRLSELSKNHEIRIFRPFLLTWGAMGRVLGYAGVKEVCRKLTAIERKIEPLRCKDLLSANLDEDKATIIDLFDEIRKTGFRSKKGKQKKVGPTAASKVLHLICPDLLVMWDSAIRAKYEKQDGDGKDYFDFLVQMKVLWEELEPVVKELQQRYGKRPTRILDQYNWMETH